MAAECVKTVAKQPALSLRTWNSPDPASQAALDGYEKAWAVLVREQQRFKHIHEFGRLIRKMGGLGNQVLLLDGAAPDEAYEFRRWDLALAGGQEIKRLVAPLKLRYAIDQGWFPGLWLKDDITLPPTKAVPRGTWGTLIPSPLRSAVGAK